jgi:hypothetical protein
MANRITCCGAAQSLDSPRFVHYDWCIHSGHNHRDRVYAFYKAQAVEGHEWHLRDEEWQKNTPWYKRIFGIGQPELPPCLKGQYRPKDI